ncbi:MAG TPA: cation:proton antiporter [Burkholderiales bacterium]|nr:cation:proton antiporter [Burkholderiales bacterium]
MMDGQYTEFAALLLLSAVLGAIAVRLRQPLIVAFIAVGILAGPSGLGWVSHHEPLELLAQIGVTVLLFVVGLKLDIGLVRHLGPVALATGLGQLAFTIVFGYLIAIGLGMGVMEALYVAIALTFSSTIIIVKLLSDKREIDSLHGRIAVGFLIVQDIAVVVAMMVMGSLGSAEETFGVGEALVTVAVKLAGALLVIAGLMRYVLPRLVGLLARSQELLLIFAISWGTALATLGSMLGFSMEVGAFLAGFSLASTVYREAISTRLTSIRDFLLLFFFVNLGSKLELSAMGEDLPSAMIFSLFVLIGNPLIVMVIMGYMGYRKRTGFMAGLTVAQISEFSIVFVAMGISLGHVTQGTLGLVTLVGIITITLSTYLILYSQPIYARIAGLLNVFERAHPFREAAVEEQPMPVDAPEVIVFGVGRYGGRLARQLRDAGIPVLGVDFDPENVTALRKQGFTVVFGDVEDADFPETLPLDSAKWVVSTLPEVHLNIGLGQTLRRLGYRGRIALTAHTEYTAGQLREDGAEIILRPFNDAADFAAEHIAGDLGATEENSK